MGYHGEAFPPMPKKAPPAPKPPGRPEGQELFGIGERVTAEINQRVLALVDESLKSLPTIDRLLHGKEVTVTIAADEIKLRIKLE